MSDGGLWQGCWWGSFDKPTPGLAWRVPALGNKIPPQRALRDFELVYPA